MGKRVFVSYRHTQSEWVLERLVPCLEAGGAEVRVDVTEFKAGIDLYGQIDTALGDSDIAVLVLSEDYFDSDYCAHEFRQAVERDPRFQEGRVVFVLRGAVEYGEHIDTGARPLHVDMRGDDRKRLGPDRKKEVARQWNLLMAACGADLDCDAPKWLRACDEVLQLMRRNQSVNLVVYGKAKWKQLLGMLKAQLESQPGDPGLAIVDLEDAETTTRRALVGNILKRCGLPTPVPDNGEELVVLKQTLAGRTPIRLALVHFDLVQYHDHYDVPFFAALKNLVMDHPLEGAPRKLVVLIVSRQPFTSLLPRDHPFSSEIQVSTVELRGRDR